MTLVEQHRVNSGLLKPRGTGESGDAGADDAYLHG
jgi:hypothetical protein